MADSIREKIMARFATVLANTSDIGTPARVYRERGTGAARDLAPCILLEWGSEPAQPIISGYAERTLFIEVKVVTRAGDGQFPSKLADPVIQSAHALIMADQASGSAGALGTLAIDTTQGDASFDYEDADKTAGVLTQVYQVLFRHSVADMAA